MNYGVFRYWQYMMKRVWVVFFFFLIVRWSIECSCVYVSCTGIA